MTESTDQTESTKKPRRRLTPEERIAERKAEIERIEAGRRERAVRAVYSARSLLQSASDQATSVGMHAEADACMKAMKALEGI